MIVTENKIKVTYDMMESAGMTRMTLDGLQVGVPRIVGRSKSLSWRSLLDLTDKDFDEIERYFISKCEHE